MEYLTLICDIVNSKGLTNRTAVQEQLGPDPPANLCLYPDTACTDLCH